MPKIRVNVTLEENLFSLAKAKGLNVSNLCEDALREILTSFDQTTLPENCKHRWSLPFSAAFGLAKECLKCHSINRVYVESHEVTMKKAEKLAAEMRRGEK